MTAIIEIPTTQIEPAKGPASDTPLLLVSSKHSSAAAGAAPRVESAPTARAAPDTVSDCRMTRPSAIFFM